jgi:hypothetical protein
MAGYAKTVSAAKKFKDRIGKSPVTIKAVKASGPNKADLVISNADADQIKSASKKLKLLEECRVIIILD